MASGALNSGGGNSALVLRATTLTYLGLMVVLPLAILGGIGRSAQLGSIIKGGLYLESLGRVDTIVLDKTGPLTEARPLIAAFPPSHLPIRPFT